MNGGVDPLVEQIPLVTGRVLLELTNGLTVASALTAERHDRGIIAQLVAQVLGRDQKAQLMTLRGLIDGQQALTQWIVEVSNRGAISDLALAQVAGHLRQTKRITAELQSRASALAADLRELSTVVAEIAQVCADRLGELEKWRAEITLRVSAQTALDTAIERWQAGRSYTDLPWAYQVLLLAREVALGPCGKWEHLYGAEFSPRLADRIVAHLRSRMRPPESFALAALLDDSINELPKEQHRQLVAQVLDAGLEPGLALPARPLTATASLATELAALPRSARPEEPGTIALELIRRRLGWIDGGATLPEFIGVAVQEQMDMARLTWQRLEVQA